MSKIDETAEDRGPYEGGMEAHLQRRVEQLKKQLAEKDKKISWLRAKVDERDKEIDRLKERIEGLYDHIDQARDRICNFSGVKMWTLGVMLTNLFAKIEKEKVEKDKEITELLDEKRVWRDLVDLAGRYAEDAEKKEKEYAEKDKEIEELRTKLDEAREALKEIAQKKYPEKFSEDRYFLRCFIADMKEAVSNISIKLGGDDG